MGEAARALLIEDFLVPYHHHEAAPVAGHNRESGDLVAVLAQDFFRHTGGVTLIPSFIAVLDLHLCRHGAST